MRSGISGVYLVKCVANGRSYVGSSKDIACRWKEHRYGLRHGAHYNAHWQHAWNKYGEKSFEWSILEETPLDGELIRKREQHWIDILKPEINIAQNVEQPSLGLKRSKATIKKQSEVRREHWARLSEDEREERRKSIADGVAKARAEKSPDEIAEWKAKITHPVSEKNKKILHQASLEWHATHEHPQKGKPVSEATRAGLERYREQRRKETEARKVAERSEWEKGRAERWAAGREKQRLAVTGKHPSDETKSKLRKAALKQQRDPDYKAKHQQAVQEAMQRPEVLKRLSESHQGKTLTEEHRRHISEAQHANPRVETEESRARRSEGAKRMWAERKANPETYKKYQHAIVQAMQSPEAKKKRAASNAERYPKKVYKFSEEHRMKLSASNKATWAKNHQQAEQLDRRT